MIYYITMLMMDAMLYMYSSDALCAGASTSAVVPSLTGLVTLQACYPLIVIDRS